MRQIIALLIAIVVFSPAFANQDAERPGGHGDRQSPEEHAATRLEYLSIVLDLTDDQIEKIQSLQSEHIATLNGIKDEYQPVMDKMKGELKEIRKTSEGAFEQSREKAEAVRNQYQPQLEPMREALKGEKDAFDKVLASVFNPGQNDKYSALKVFKEAHRPKMGKPGKPMPPHGKMKQHGPDGFPGHNGCHPQKRQLEEVPE